MNLEAKILKKWRGRLGAKPRFLLAVSGGLDSVVLLEILHRLAPKLGAEIRVAHVHHGAQGLPGAYRDQAQQFVQQLATARQFEFVTNELPPTKKIAGEEGLRDFRYKCLQSWQRAGELIVTAHTSDDLFETHLLRLIRGVGYQGLRESIRFHDGQVLRPLLDFSRAELTLYARWRRLKWLNDPSNEDPKMLRNWVRHKWLPALEKRQVGARAALMRSLQNVAENAHSANDWSQVVSATEINHSRFIELPIEERRQVLARYMRQLGMKNYGRSHIEEVLKRLDRAQKEHTFSLLKHDWTVCPKRILASPQTS